MKGGNFRIDKDVAFATPPFNSLVELTGVSQSTFSGRVFTVADLTGNLCLMNIPPTGSVATGKTFTLTQDGSRNRYCNYN